MQVVYYHRKRRLNANFSIESVFERVRQALPPEIDARVRVAPFLSNGIFRRLAIAIDARRHQGQINHVTGDINFAGLLLDRRRTVLTSHDCSYLARCTGLKRRLLKLFWLDLPVRRARFVTTVSEAAKRDILSNTKCDPEKIVVIYNPIAAEYLHRPKDFNVLNPRVLQIGTAPNKNIPRLLQALKGIDCTFVIIGNLNDEVLGLIQEHRIRYENYKNLSLAELIRQYELSDMVVFASTIEGFGLPILEANAVGRPVVTSNLSSMPEVAGNAACLVDPLDVESVRAGILRVLREKSFREELIRNGLENVRRFQPDTIAADYLRLYRQILNESKSFPDSMRSPEMRVQ
jgi:glycosyltransferase involved in cell wall biosynthesis